jgi:hypothetical protein
MREAIDTQGQGENFMRLYVHNPNPQKPDPQDEKTDLAMLELYEYWRTKYKLRPIEPWDGTTLRPWLPQEANPQVPLALQELESLLDAYTRFSNIPGEGEHWKRIDVLGNILESYYREIQSHSVWARPNGGGRLRFYRFNGLNNIETAPYSVLFWGFLKWSDNLRKQLFGLPVEPYPHDSESDITFLLKLNQNHFTWHDDVFEKGRCTRIDDQLGRQQRHKYGMNTKGYGIEFLRYHRDLIRRYDAWSTKMGYPPIQSWRSGHNHNAYVLKEAWGWYYARNGTNGQPLDPAIYAPELLEPGLPAFPSVAALGYYLEQCRVKFHGIGHIENCDIRDVYTNNYSIRFFRWHKWIDELVDEILDSGRPWGDERPDSSIGEPIPNFKEKYPQLEQPQGFLSGRWTYRSFNHENDPEKDPRWFVATMQLQQVRDQLIGELDSGHPDYQYTIKGHIDGKNVVYETTPEWWDDRKVVILTATGATAKTKGHTYEYIGYIHPDWPTGKKQVDAFVGTVARTKRPDDPSKEGKVGSFMATRVPGEQIFFQSGRFVVPEKVEELEISAWGAGGGGGSDGPGTGADDGKVGGDTMVSQDKKHILQAFGGEGGGHGIFQLGKGGKGGGGVGHTIANGEDGEDGGTAPGQSGKGGDADGMGDVGGSRVGRDSDGEDGRAPGGGGSGAQQAHSPGGGGGGGGFVTAKLPVKPGERLELTIGKGGKGGDKGALKGGSGADGRIRILWKMS